MLHIFGNKNVLLAGVVVLLLAIVAIATRSTMQTAGADTGNPIQKRNEQLKEAFRMVEGR